MATLEAYESHVAALEAGDVDAVVAGYAEDAVLIANGAVYDGREAMRPLFERSRGKSILDRDLTTKVVVEGDIVYVSWRAREAGSPELAGVDTFIITDGLITTHTGFYVPLAEPTQS